MRGDFTRDSFEPASRFRRVLLQQGRVQLDADFNEQSSILLRQGEILTTALLGRFGGPRNIIDAAGRWAPNNGFLIGAGDSFAIGSGRYFVDGLLCENFAAQDFLEQPDFPTTDDDAPPTGGGFLVYLEVFERSLVAAQDDTIAEPALEGVDTAARSRLIWQVRLLVPPTALPLPTGPIDDLAWNAWLDVLDPPGRGLLRARTETGPTTEVNPCIVPIASAFRGEDNQLYRVEIHDGGDDHRELRREEVLPLFRVEDVRRDDRLVVLEPRDGVDLPEYEANDPRHPLLRRWDGGDAKSITEVPASSDAARSLENGIEIQFLQQGVPPRYRPGDYWLIPARVALGDIIWPEDDSGARKALPPHGITRHFAPLAARGTAAFVDLRRLFDPLGRPPP
jgi:hypothetical protein